MPRRRYSSPIGATVRAIGSCARAFSTIAKRSSRFALALSALGSRPKSLFQCPQAPGRNLLTRALVQVHLIELDRNAYWPGTPPPRDPLPARAAKRICSYQEISDDDDLYNASPPRPERRGFRYPQTTFDSTQLKLCPSKTTQLLPLSTLRLRQLKKEKSWVIGSN
jgi:hypothetical protein